MMPLSKRISALKPSPTLGLNARAKALAQSGVSVFNFGVGEPDFSPPASVIEAATKALQAGKFKYGPAGGSLRLRRAIAAKLLRDNDLTFAPDDIVVGIGAKEILFHLFLSLLNEGDEVIIPSPYWVSYIDQVLAAGGRPVILPMPNICGGAASPIPIDLLKKHTTPRTVAIILNSPNNPSGYILKPDHRRELVSFLKTNQWWIVSDEIYEYLAFDTPHHSLLHAEPELANRFILINGLSKGFAMTGWRVGYAAGPSPVINLITSLQGHSSTCLPPFIEEAAIEALALGPAAMTAKFALLHARRDLAVQCLAAIPDIQYVPPEGAFYILIDVRQHLARAKRLPRRDTWALSDYLLEEHHVALVPGAAFGAEGFLRLSYATDDNTIRSGIAALGRGLAGLS